MGSMELIYEMSSRKLGCLLLGTIGNTSTKKTLRKLLARLVRRRSMKVSFFTFTKCHYYPSNPEPHYSKDGVFDVTFSIMYIPLLLPYLYALLNFAMLFSELLYQAHVILQQSSPFNIITPGQAQRYQVYHSQLLF